MVCLTLQMNAGIQVCILSKLDDYKRMETTKKLSFENESDTVVTDSDWQKVRG